jgi:hypothetical protein
MKDFQTIYLTQNIFELEKSEWHTFGLIKLLEQQTMVDGTLMHGAEFKSYNEYAEYVEPFLDDGEQGDMMTAAVGYVSQFFYLKGLQDGSQIRDKLFMGGGATHG